MLSQVQWSESHSPLKMSVFVGWDSDICTLLTESNSETNGIFAVCRRLEELNTVHMWHTQSIGTNRRKWAINTVPIHWPRTPTQNVVFQYSVSRTFWSQHNRQLRYSITWGTNSQIQHSHERPALPLSRIHCILMFVWWYRSLVTHPDQFNL